MIKDWILFPYTSKIILASIELIIVIFTYLFVWILTWWFWSTTYVLYNDKYPKLTSSPMNKSLNKLTKDQKDEEMQEFLEKMVEDGDLEDLKGINKSLQTLKQQQKRRIFKENLTIFVVSK
jgi:hypothetical protein